MIERPDPADLNLECVEPEVGKQLWQLTDPGLEPDLRRRLEAHRTICDACRLTHLVETEVERLITQGEVRVPGARRGARLVAAGGGFAVAAALALAFVVPPEASGPSVLRRGVDDVRIVRPVEGEVVATDRPRLDWTPIPGATAYRVEISAMDGDHHWSGRLTAPPATLPPEAALPVHGRYRAIIAPVPDDLARPGDLSVSFMRAGVGRFMAYRLVAAPWFITVLGVFGLAGLVGALARMRPR